MRRLVSAVSVLVLVSCGGAPPPPAKEPKQEKAEPAAPDINQELEAIHKLFQSRSYANAFKQAEQLTKEHPKSGAAQLILGKAAFYLEKDTEAQQALETALKYDPQMPDAHFYLGLLAMYSDRAKEAELRFAQAAKLSPENALYWYELGKQRQRLDDLQGARSALSKSLEVDPKGRHAAQAHFSLGSLSSGAGEHDSAVKEWEQALLLDTQYVDAHYNLGLHHALRGDPQKSLEHFTRASELAPEDIQILSKVIQAHYRLEQYEKAADVRERLLQLHANSPDEKVRAMKSYCFDQFVIGEERFFAYETIDKSGDLVYWYFFKISKNDQLLNKTIQLEQSAILKENGGGFVLGQDEGGRHTTFTIGFKELPNYPALKAAVIDAHAGKLKAGASSEHR